MIKTIIMCDRCGLIMAQVDSSGPMAEDRLISLAEKCGHTVDSIEDVCRECLRVMALAKCDNGDDPIGDDVITKRIVVPSGCRQRSRTHGRQDRS